MATWAIALAYAELSRHSRIKTDPHSGVMSIFGARKVEGRVQAPLPGCDPHDPGYDNT
jgi:hypothetical protein